MSDGDRTAAGGGVDALIADVSHRARLTPATWSGKAHFVLEIGQTYANIRLQDLVRPRRFLGQMAGPPPIQFGTKGFRETLVDDANPTRHYTAFVWIGFWLPYALALLLLYMWEVAGFVRYRGHWSQKDIDSGLVGMNHGRLLRRFGPSVLPALIARDLAVRPPDQSAGTHVQGKVGGTS